MLTRGENRLYKKILSYEVLIERLLFHADDYHTTKQTFVDRSISAANDRFGSVTDVCIRPKADIHTFRAIIPRTLHSIDSSSFGSVCQKQLIYSPWVSGRKVYSGEGLRENSDDENLC